MKTEISVFILFLLGIANAEGKAESGYGLRFIRVYPPHSPAEKLGIFTYVCAKRLRQIAQEKLNANEQAVQFSNTLRSFLSGMEKYFKDDNERVGSMCSSFHSGEHRNQTKPKTTGVPLTIATTVGTELGITRTDQSQLRKRREAKYMAKSILPKVPKKVYKMAIRAERSRNSMEQVDETSIEIEDQEELRLIRESKLVKQKQIDKIREVLRKRIDWFDIYEFLHEVGASQKLMHSLSPSDLDAVTQCQNGLFKLIVRNTSNCDLTERLVLEALQWFETFKQYYSCVIHKEDPEANPHVQIKPWDHRLKAQTFLLTSLTPAQCKPRHTEC